MEAIVAILFGALELILYEDDRISYRKLLLFFLIAAVLLTILAYKLKLD
jgi:intracellular septation protein A